MHRARVLIYQRHIRVGKQIVTSPSFLVRKSSQSHMNFREGSSLASSGGPGRRKRRNLKKKAAKAKAKGGGDAEA